MERDEDTVMGEAGSHHPHPTTTSHHLTDGVSDQHQMPTHLLGRSDPWLAPPLLGSSIKPSTQSGDGTGDAGVSPPKSLPKSTDSGDATAEDLDKPDSLVEENSNWSDDDVATRTGLPIASLASGLCYDVQMRYHCEVRPSTDVHPEDPRRIYYIYKELCRAGLVDDSESSRPLVSRPLQRISARNATEDEVSLVHTPDHFAFVESTKGKSLPAGDIFILLETDTVTDMSDEELIQLEHQRDSIYFNKLTFASSLLSVGGAIETCLAVATRKVKNAIAVIRPPGHHAEHDKTMGFCLFNNVSVAARVCQRELGDSCRKIMILDW